jgi:2-polyprenyl-6-hydroxyphenyl methylase/3-demethylubiquinone-9 3-methyltransferase
MMEHTNSDPREIAQFESLANRWWDPDGEFKPLHQINPLRMEFVTRRQELKNKAVLDVGCGGGILSESMALSGATVTGIDLAQSGLAVARLHLEDSGLDIDYQHISVEALAEDQPGSFDVVTCMEMLEHVPNPSSVIASCSALVKPGGSLFFSTINRNPKAYLMAVLGAEYLLRLLPAGTHDYSKFIRPSELASWCRQAGLSVEELTGLHYNPLKRDFYLGSNVDVNYLAYCRRVSGADHCV